MMVKQNNATYTKHLLQSMGFKVSVDDKIFITTNESTVLINTKLKRQSRGLDDNVMKKTLKIKRLLLFAYVDLKKVWVPFLQPIRNIKSFNFHKETFNRDA